MHNPSSTTHSHSPPMTNDDEPTNILVVDDLPEKLLAYQTILEELGQNLVMVGSGEDALRAVLRQDFAVILLDVNMPRMSGLETAAIIRKRKRSSHTPIIFVTAFADEVLAAEGYAQGAVDYITTPIVPAILRAKVRVFADLYRMTQQVKRQAEERISLAEERSKRESAEEANRQLSFLARAGAVLGQSLDPDVTARDVVRLTLPVLADAAALLTLHTDGRAAKFFRSNAGGDGVITRVDESNEWERPDEEFGDAIGRAFVGIRPAPDQSSVIAFPLQVRAQTFAVLALSRVPSRRPFTPAHLSLAEAFASRAASALENARLYQELQQADRQKNEFLSMLAHELRNPLAPIRNATAVLSQRELAPDRLRWAHGVIDRQISHLVRLVDDLLDVSRITLGKIRLVVEPVGLEEVVSLAVEAVRPLVEQLKHELGVILPPRRIRLNGDKARLTQVFTNLLQNAAKYTEPGGRISLTASVEARGEKPEERSQKSEARGEKSEGRSQKPEDGNQNGLSSPLSSAIAPTSEVVIRVRDTGIGISAELLPTVFDLFTQANRSLDRSQGGLGVGLTLVRRLVEMHGGSVEALSEGPGCGSEFVVRLPAEVQELASPHAAATLDRGNAATLRVVVVDDNEDGADSLGSLLELLGHEVRVAYDGPAGIAAVHGFDPHLVLLDIGLPGMDGYEVARRLRADPGVRAVLAAVSGYGRDEDRRMSQEAGFECHFVKPVEFDMLRKLLASVRPT